ncbi:RNA polymerase sigma factor [Thalassotalea maritima]|uniref:RNA polymerase sigma factor n=1 Tax=Thalassotalea maritima TaxID=3242416 RepID=UPI0035287164
MKPDFNQLWHQHRTGIARLVMSYEANHDVQDELIQEIGLAIWRSLEKCRDEEKIKAFIYRIAHNQAINHVSRQVKQVDTTPLPCEQLDANEGDHKSGIYTEKQHALLTAMRSLPMNQRQVISLLFEGFSYKQIADITGFTMSHVGVLMNRGKYNLKERLDES